MKIVSEIENVFIELLFFEHQYLVYSKSITMHVSDFLFKS